MGVQNSSYQILNKTKEEEEEIIQNTTEPDQDDMSMFSESSNCKSQGDLGVVEAEEEKQPEDKKKILAQKLLKTKE